MTKRDWSSIHGEVEDTESIKIHSSGVGSKMEQKKERKTLAALSCPFYYIYIYIFMHCEKKRLLNACMTENGMCVFA